MAKKKRKQKEWIELRKKVVAEVNEKLRSYSYSRSELFECVSMHGISMNLFKSYMEHSNGVSVMGLRVDVTNFLKRLDEENEWVFMDELLALSSYRYAHHHAHEVRKPWSDENFYDNVPHWWFCEHGRITFFSHLQDHSPEMVAFEHRMNFWNKLRPYPGERKKVTPKDLEGWYRLLELKRPPVEQPGKWGAHLLTNVSNVPTEHLRIREAFFASVPPPRKGR